MQGCGCTMDDWQHYISYTKAALDNDVHAVPCMHTHTHTHTQTHTHVYTHVHAHICTHTCMQRHTCTCTHILAHKDTCIHTRAHTKTHMQMHIHTGLVNLQFGTIQIFLSVHNTTLMICDLVMHSKYQTNS